jgi:hypothetical protein
MTYYVHHIEKDILDDIDLDPVTEDNIFSQGIKTYII